MSSGCKMVQLLQYNRSNKLQEMKRKAVETDVVKELRERLERKTAINSCRLRLESIEIEGFKSYRDRQIIGPFDPHFTW